MPPCKVWQPKTLEDQCIQRYLYYMKDETDIIFHIRAYESRSVLLRNVNPNSMVRCLDKQLCHGLQGILQDIVRQKMADILIHDLHNLAAEAIKTLMSSRSYQILAERLITEKASLRVGNGRTSPAPDDSSSSSPMTSLSFLNMSPTYSWSSALQSQISRPSTLTSNYRSLPVFQLLELVLNEHVKILDFSKNRDWIESEEMNEFARILWKIVGERCKKLQKFVIPKELTYSSTLNSVIVNGSCLTQLTLKRNIPNNMFLHEIGSHCPKLQELDIAGAEVVTDFGMVCLLYADPEQIFLKCWNREKTVGQQKRSMRAFPHPHFDKPIPDQQEPQPRGTKSASGGNFLYLRRSFHEGLRSDSGDAGDWERLPLASTLQKLRLENTKVKGDGASVVLETCPNVYSLGYLVFAAAGLKQVFGYEDRAETKFTEIFYRGPSDQKLSTIANCCPNLETMFLGSNNPRSLNPGVFQHWPRLSYLTLENIMVENIVHCLEEVGAQLRGLKIQCCGFDLSDIAVLCPNLKSLIIQKEAPNPVVNSVRSSKTRLFGQLEHVEVSCQQFSKQCFGFILKNAVNLVSIKVLHVPKLNRSDFESWLCTNPLQKLESMIIFKAHELTLDAVTWILSELDSITELGDLHSMELSKNNADIRKLHQEIKKNRWSVNLIDSSQGIETEERDFGKLQSLHWFYLTPSDGYKQISSNNSR